MTQPNEVPHANGTPEVSPRLQMAPDAARAAQADALNKLIDDSPDAELAGLIGDQLSGADRVFALMATPNKRELMAVTEFALVKASRWDNGGVSVVNVPLLAIEALALKPMAGTEAGFLSMFTPAVKTEVKFPIGTHLDYFRAVAVVQIIRGIQQHDVRHTMHRLGLTEYPASIVFGLPAPPAPPAPPAVAAPAAVVQQPAVAPAQPAPQPLVSPAASSGSAQVASHMAPAAPQPAVLKPQAVLHQPAPPPEEEADEEDEGDVDWYLYRADAEHGPYPFSQLQEWFGTGGLVESDYIRAYDMGEWKTPEEIFGPFPGSNRPARPAGGGGQPQQRPRARQGGGGGGADGQRRKKRRPR